MAKEQQTRILLKAAKSSYLNEETNWLVLLSNNWLSDL